MIDPFSPRFTSRSTPLRTSRSPNFLCRSSIFSSGCVPAAPLPALLIRTPTRRQERAGYYPARCILHCSEAVIGVWRLIALLAVNADARILLRWDEPRLVLHTVLRHHLHVQAVLPHLLDRAVDGLGELWLILVDAEYHAVLDRHDWILVRFWCDRQLLQLP